MKLFKVRVNFTSKVTGKEITQQHKVIAPNKVAAYHNVLASFKQSSVECIRLVR
jgi:hypothetical protein